MPVQSLTKLKENLTLINFHLLVLNKLFNEWMRTCSMVKTGVPFTLMPIVCDGHLKLQKVSQRY